MLIDFNRDRVYRYLNKINTQKGLTLPYDVQNAHVDNEINLAKKDSFVLSKHLSSRTNNSHSKIVKIKQVIGHFVLSLFTLLIACISIL